jgi:hypothetical protein
MRMRLQRVERKRGSASETIQRVVAQGDLLFVWPIKVNTMNQLDHTLKRAEKAEAKLHTLTIQLEEALKWVIRERRNDKNDHMHEEIRALWAVWYG